MFEIYLASCHDYGRKFFYFSDFDFHKLLKLASRYDVYVIERCEIIEGIYYPIKTIARSAYVV